MLQLKCLKSDDTLLANDYILLLKEGFSKVTFFANEIGILSVDLDKINLDDKNNSDEDDPEALSHVRPLTRRYKFEKRNAIKRYISK